MCFAKKLNQKDQKMQTNTAKVMSACAEASKTHVKPKEIKLTVPEG